MERGIVVLVIVLIAVSLVGLVLFFSGGGLGDTGRGYGAQGNENSSEQLSLWLAVFAVPLAVALAVIVYALLFPKIKVEKKGAVTIPVQTASAPAPAPVEKSQTLEAVLRVLNADEQKVVNAIANSPNGEMLQKDIKWKTGLSRVKTHRVLARLAARRIVVAEKYYNTNKIVLADWIAKDKENSS